MIEMMIINQLKIASGLTGDALSRSNLGIGGGNSSISDDGRYFATGNQLAADKKGAVYIVDISVRTAPAIVKEIILPEWQAGNNYTGAGFDVQASGDMRTIVTNTSLTGNMYGALWVMELDSEFNVVAKQKIIHSDIASSAWKFGKNFMIDKSGTVIAVSTEGWFGDTGCVYIYKKVSGTWSLEYRLARPSSSTAPYFGTALSLSDDGEFMIVSSGGGTWGISKPILFKRNNGAWNSLMIFPDNHNLSGSGFSRGIISGDGTRLFIAYSYNNVGSDFGGIDTYSVTPTGTVTSIGNILSDNKAISFEISAQVTANGEYLLISTKNETTGKYTGFNCYASDSDAPSGYKLSWKWNFSETNETAVYPAVSRPGTVWAATDPARTQAGLDSMAIGK